MDRATFLEQRKSFIGGSDAACILGVSPWSTAYDVWLEKTGQAGEMPDNSLLEWGQRIEPILRQAYQEKTGRQVVCPAAPMYHPKHSFIGGNLDGLTAGKVVEFKNVNTYATKEWGDPGTDEIPPQYIAQCQHYMMITDLDVADVAVLIGGNDFRIYHVDADKDLQDTMLEAEIEFWTKHVEPKIAPPVTTLRDVSRAYPKSVQSAVTAPVDVWQSCQKLSQIKACLKTYEEQKDVQEAIIKGFMADNDTLITADKAVLATWKSSKDKSIFDTEKFKAVNPELYQKYITTAAGSRRFLLKNGNGGE